jgi:hypothetical protein
MPNETFKEYTDRLMGYLGKQDPVKVMSSTPGKIERLIKGVPQNKLSKRPLPGKWSVKEILVHLCDDEIAIGWRMRIMITRPGVGLTAFDQDSWVKSFNYAKFDAKETLAAFSSLRKFNLKMLRHISASEFRNAYGMHEERGIETLEFFVRLNAGHDLNHLRQIRAILM